LIRIDLMNNLDWLNWWILSDNHVIFYMFQSCLSSHIVLIVLESRYLHCSNFIKFTCFRKRRSRKGIYDQCLCYRSRSCSWWQKSKIERLIH
jgi:hypothetical protein